MRIYLLLALSSSALLANTSAEIPKDIKPLVEFMSVASDHPKYVGMARNDKDCIDDYKRLEHSYTLPFQKQDKQLKFAVMTSLSGPPNSFQKKWQDANPQLQQDLNTLIKTQFNNHNDRVAAIKNLCQSKTEMEKIQLASHLGSKLSGIYDYDRKSGAIVKPEDQWQALNNQANGQKNAVSGVCRDTTLTVTQFLMNCGFDKKQLGIQSYRTEDSGHQIVTIRDSKGELYTINWSDLYSTDEKGGVAPELNPSNLNVGLEYYTYDADGKLVASRKTELGNIIKAVAGGTISSPDYLPDVLRLEAQFGAFTGNLFTANTTSGEKATGAALAHKQTMKQDTVYISMGAAYVNNKKEVDVGGKKPQSMEQTILYFQMETGYSPKFEIERGKNAKITIRPLIVGSSEFYRVDNESQGKKTDNFVSNISGKVGGQIQYENDRFALWTGATTDLGVRNMGNTEYTGTGIGVFQNTTSFNAGVGHKTQNYVMTLEAQSNFSYHENNYTVATSVFDKRTNSSGSVMYQVYDRGQGWREDYVLVQGEKHFSLERVGKVAVGFQAQVPIEGKFEDSTYYATLKFGGGKR